MGTISMKDINEDIKFLIELGGYRQINEDNSISVAGFSEKETVHGKVIKILSPNMKTPDIGEDIVILNPFKQVQVNTIALSKFYRLLAYVPARFIHRIMERTIQLHESNSQCSIDEVAWISKFEGTGKEKLIDAKTLEEFHKVLTENRRPKTNQLLSIKYDRKAEQTRVTSDFLKNVDNYNIRKKTKKLLKKIYHELLGEDLSVYNNKPTHLINRQNEAFFSTLHDIYEKMEHPIRVVVGIDVNLKRLRGIIANLEKYAKFTNHIVDISEADGEEISIPDNTVVKEEEPEKTKDEIRNSLTLDNIITPNKIPQGIQLTLPPPPTTNPFVPMAPPVVAQGYAPMVQPVPLMQQQQPMMQQQNPFQTNQMANTFKKF